MAYRPNAPVAETTKVVRVIGPNVPAPQGGDTPELPTIGQQWPLPMK